MSEEDRFHHDFAFRNPSEYEFPEGKVKVIDILPERFSDSTPIMLAPGWSEDPSAYKDSIKFVTDNENKYDTVFITSDLGRPYIYYLFYQKDI